MNNDGAMVAKARAMFGERLGAGDYEALLQKKNIADIVAFLKTDKLFEHTLEGVNEKAVHRGQLEVLLRLNVYDRLRKLLRYGSKEDGQFLIAAGMNTEIEMILMCIRTLINPDSDEKEQLIASMPMYIVQYLSFDISKLVDVYSYEELLDLLKETKYYKILLQYRNSELQELDMVSLEHDMRDAYYANLISMASSSAKGEEKKLLVDMITKRIELENVTLIYRLKKYFKLPGDKIAKQLTSAHSLFSARELQKMIDASSPEEVLEMLKKKYHRYVKEENFTYIERYTERIAYNMYYTTIETSAEPYLVLLSYLQLSLAEIRNLINILEGARYGVSKDRVRALLVY